MASKRSSGVRIGVFQSLCDVPAGDPALVAKRAEELGFDSYWVPEHAVIPEGERVAGVLGISRAGLDFDTPDGREVHAVVLLATPNRERRRHLEVLTRRVREGLGYEVQQRFHREALSYPQLVSFLADTFENGIERSAGAAPVLD